MTLYVFSLTKSSKLLIVLLFKPSDVTYAGRNKHSIIQRYWCISKCFLHHHSLITFTGVEKWIPTSVCVLSWSPFNNPFSTSILTIWLTNSNSVLYGWHGQKLSASYLSERRPSKLLPYLFELHEPYELSFCQSVSVGTGEIH